MREGESVALAMQLTQRVRELRAIIEGAEREVLTVQSELTNVGMLQPMIGRFGLENRPPFRDHPLPAAPEVNAVKLSPAAYSCEVMEVNRVSRGKVQVVLKVGDRLDAVVRPLKNMGEPRLVGMKLESPVRRVQKKGGRAKRRG